MQEQARNRWDTLDAAQSDSAALTSAFPEANVASIDDEDHEEAIPAGPDNENAYTDNRIEPRAKSCQVVDVWNQHCNQAQHLQKAS